MKANQKLIAISSGNSKIGRGVYNISTLPGDKKHLITKKDGTVLSTVPGTCNGMCATCYNYCYAVPAAKRYPTA